MDAYGYKGHDSHKKCYRSFTPPQNSFTLTAGAAMTDDPMKGKAAMATLRSGAAVTYLSSFINQRGEVWDYIETTVGGKPARGFIPSNNIDYAVDPLFDAEMDEVG